MRGVPRPGSRDRVADFAEDTPDGLVLHEVKTGVTNRTSDLDQCQKDAHPILCGRSTLDGPLTRTVASPDWAWRWS